MKLNIPKTLTFKVVLSAGIAVLCSSFVMMAIIQAIVSSFYKEEIGFQVNQKTKQVSTLLDGIAAKSKESLGVAQVDFKLANSILLATYTRNPDEVVSELKILGHQMGFTFFQIVDAFGNVQATSEASNLPIKPGDHSVGAEILESSSALPIIASTGPIELYGENIGTVTIGYYLDKTLMDNIADGSGVDIAYFDGDRPVTASVKFKTSDTTRMTFLNGGAAIKAPSGHQFQVAVETTRYHSTLMKLILWTVLITFMAILATVLVLWKVMRNNFIDHFKNLLSSVTKQANLVKNNQSEALLLVPDTSETVEFSQLAHAINTLIDKVGTSNRQLVEASKHAELGNLSSQVAHDIRSPLSSMRSALMLLREQFGNNKDAEELFNLLQLSSNRLDNIANGLLAKYMGEAAAEQLFSIHEVLDELVGELRASPLGQGTEFKKQYHTAALYVTGDKTGMARAIGNIIKNALEAMQQTSVDRPNQLIVVTAYDGSQNLTIRIQDTGPGIPADKIPLILQGGHTEGKTDGHGIGTKVVKEMVENHKGHLSIESQVGVGTTFIITLPATIQNDETIVTIPHAGSGVICVIDDEPSLREQWRLTLRSMGVTAKVFTCWEDFDAAKAGIASEGTFIIDFHYDNSLVDGLEVIRRLKERGFTKFVLATAEYWKPAIKDVAKKLGIVLCPKPLPKVVLSQPVQQHQALQVESTTQEPTGRTVLLIDDDDAIRLTWNVIKKRLGVATLHSFPSLEAVIQANVNPSDCDLCVIDKNIEGSQYDGARMLEYLKQNGAKKVVLATGETASDIKKDPKFDSLDGITAEKIPSSLDKFLN